MDAKAPVRVAWAARCSRLQTREYMYYLQAVVKYFILTLTCQFTIKSSVRLYKEWLLEFDFRAETGNHALSLILFSGNGQTKS